jgi:arsenate reductase
MSIPSSVLFLCTGNSCRSIMAEALLNQLGAGRFKASSAGSFPTGRVHPESIRTLERHKVNPGTPYSKSLNEFSNEKFDLVVTVCDQAAGESYPLFLEQVKKQHWSIPDPAKAQGSEEDIRKAFESAFSMLKSHIEDHYE